MKHTETLPPSLARSTLGSTHRERTRCMAHVQRARQKRVSLHMQNKSFHVYSNRSSRILFVRALLIWLARCARSDIRRAHSECHKQQFI